MTDEPLDPDRTLRDYYAKATPEKRQLVIRDALIRAAEEGQPLTPSQRIAAAYAANTEENDQQ